MDNINEKLNEIAAKTQRTIDIENIITKGIKYLNDIENDVKNAKPSIDIFIDTCFYDNFIEEVRRNIYYNEYTIERNKDEATKITIISKMKLIEIDTRGDLNFCNNKTQEFISGYIINYIGSKMICDNKFCEIEEAIKILGGELSSYNIFKSTDNYANRFSIYFGYKITLIKGKLFNKIREMYHI